MNYSHNARGSVILLALAMVVMSSGVGLVMVNRAHTDAELSFDQVHYDQASWLADAGAERAVAVLKDSSAWRDGYQSVPLSDGCYSVSVTDGDSDSSLDDHVRVVSLGQCREAAGGVEVILAPAGYHPLYECAIYSGNYWEHQRNTDSAVAMGTLKFSGTGSEADIINGDVFFNGRIRAAENATINGSAEAGGHYSGKAPTEGSASNVNYLSPPNLQAMNYETTADYTINASCKWDKNGRIAESDPRHIFVRSTRSDVAPPGTRGTDYRFSNKNYFFGDPWEGAGLDEISISPAGNDKVYFVDGNLWIEPEGATLRLIHGPAAGTHVTVVVKGNIYIADELQYESPDKDGIALVAMTDGESYVDADDDGCYDEGEAILHDDGDGVYEGPTEGSGNIWLGDPEGGPLGHVYAFLYADNDIIDQVQAPGGAPLGFEVTGTLSAGNKLDLRRDVGALHAALRVNQDIRLRDGLLQLPGLPSADDGGSDKLVVVAWREL